MALFTCDRCGKKFTASPVHRPNEKKYCSRICSNKSHPYKSDKNAHKRSPEYYKIKELARLKKDLDAGIITREYVKNIVVG